MFTLEQMQTLIAIVDAGSLTKAAQQLGKTKGAISVMLGNLEDELGIKLFNRSGWKLTLTDPGSRVYNHALLWQRQAFHILGSSYTYAEGIESTIRLGIQKIIPAIEFHDKLEVFRDSFPHTRLHLVRGNDDQLVKSLKSGEIDLLIRVQTSSEMAADLKFSNAGLLEFVFACAPDDTLADLDVIDNEQLLARPQIILDLGESSTTDKQKVSYDCLVSATREDFLYQVELSQGWCLLPKSLFLERAALGSLIQIKPDFEGQHATVIAMEVVSALDKVSGPALNSLKIAFSKDS